MKYAIVNCDIFTGKQVLYDKSIIINGENIEEIVDIDRVPKNLEILDLNGANIAPGFIDLQVNGGGGCLFNDSPTEECISSIYNAHKRFGTTNFLPTLITTSNETMLQAIDTVKDLMKTGKYGVLGLHLEGPYIDKGKAGVHDKSFVRKVLNDELKSYLKSGNGVIKLFTVAPEVVEESCIKMMKECDIVISGGHTNATYDQTNQFFNWGASSVTHLFNAMSQFGSREPGVVGAAFDFDKIWAGIIVDGFHVNFSSVRIAKKIKGEKLILVTDAMPPVGTNISSFNLGDLEVYYNDGQCVTEDGTLAGSALDMATAVRNCVQKVGIPMQEALRMASTYPAKVLGLENKLGKIKPGYLANMVVFNNQLIVKGIITNGKQEIF